MKINIVGGSGFIGSRLRHELEVAGHEVGFYSRKPAGGALLWDPPVGPPPPGSLHGVDVIVYLAGESVAHRWTDDLKRKIRESRILGTRNLVRGIAASTSKPSALICSSASGYYGDRGEEELTEESGAGTGFLAEVCQEWEREADAATELGLRVLKMRTGMVLGRGGGALERLTQAFKNKMGGKLGSGKQWIPWIHMDDILGLYQCAIETDAGGVWNGSAPNPVRNEALTEGIASSLGEPAKMTVPEFALKLMFGEMAEILLSSEKMLPKAATEAGYRFRWPELGSALDDVIGKK